MVFVLPILFRQSSVYFTYTLSISEILKALADGTIHDVDAALYEEILPSANRMGDPSQRDEEL